MTPDEIIAKARAEWCQPEMPSYEYLQCPPEIVAALLDVLSAEADRGTFVRGSPVARALATIEKELCK